MWYFFPQQALNDFRVAGHFVLRPTACPAQGHGNPWGDFASLGTFSDPEDASPSAVVLLSGVAVLKDCQWPIYTIDCAFIVDALFQCKSLQRD